MKRLTIPGLLLLTLLFGACSKRADYEPALDQETKETTPSNRVDINATVRSNLGITFAKVERREVADTLRIPGAFELQPLARHEYRIMLSGTVDLLVDQYQNVKPGDILYRFHSPEWIGLKKEILIGEQQVEESSVEIDVARAKLQQVKNQLERLQGRLEALASAEFKSAELGSEAENLHSSLPTLEAQIKLTETRRANAERMREHALHRAATATGIEEKDLVKLVEHNGEKVQAYRAVDWIEVRATEGGVVEKLSVTDGAFVEASTLVITTVDPNRVRFRATALQSDMPYIKPGSKARIVPPRSKGLSINDSIDAPVFIGLEAHPDQRTITVIASPEEKKPWVHPGVSAFLEIVTGSSEGPALAIPRSAVVKDGTTHVFFRRDPSDPNKAIRMVADMGIDDGRWVVIQSGLSLNDEVVLDGAYELKLATAQSGTSQKGGHFHADGSFHGEQH